MIDGSEVVTCLASTLPLSAFRHDTLVGSCVVLNSLEELLPLGAQPSVVGGPLPAIKTGQLVACVVSL